MKEYNDVYMTPGAFSWNELSCPDPNKATEFYGALFGWGFDTMNLGQGDYHVVKVGEVAVGGICAPMQPGMPAMWGAYVTVESCDATVEKAKGLGAKVLAGPFDIPNVGRMAVIQDPQGAVLQVINYFPRTE
jgi:predicted enzyme related to lactoylglutathione lyase